MKTIREFTKEGSKMNPEHAMKLLIDEYINQCGLSYGYRAVLLEAIDSWFRKLEGTDSVFAEAAPVCYTSSFFWHLFNSEYNAKDFEAYLSDGWIKTPELHSIKRMMVKEYGETKPEMCSALCCGIHMYAKFMKDCMDNPSFEPTPNPVSIKIEPDETEVWGYYMRDSKELMTFTPEKHVISLPHAKEYNDYKEALKEWYLANEEYHQFYIES